MKKVFLKYFGLWIIYFLFVIAVNKLFSISYWPLFIGGIVGLFLPYIDHLLHIFVFNPQELTSQRVTAFFKNKQYKEAIKLLIDTRDERKKLIFHTFYFQVIFAVLTFWVVSSSGNLFARGLVLSYSLSLVLFNLKKFLKNEIIFEDKDKTRIYFAIQVLALFIFGFLL